MQTQSNNSVAKRKQHISYLFTGIFFAMLVFLSSVLKTIASDRRIPSHNTTIHDRSLRGEIVSADGYILSDSHKSYTAIVRGESITPEKRELFIRLFSIYSGIEENKLKKNIL